MAAPSPARVQQLADDLLRIGVISPDQHARAVERGLDPTFAQAFESAALTSGGSRDILVVRLLGQPELPLGPPGGVGAAVATPSSLSTPYVAPPPTPPMWEVWGGLLLLVGIGLLVWGFFFKVVISSSSYNSDGNGIVNHYLIQTKLTLLILGATSFVSGMVALAAGSVIKWTRHLEGPAVAPVGEACHVCGKSIARAEVVMWRGRTMCGDCYAREYGPSAKAAPASSTTENL